MSGGTIDNTAGIGSGGGFANLPEAVNQGAALSAVTVRNLPMRRRWG